MGAKQIGAIEKHNLTDFKVKIIEGSRDANMHISFAPICFTPIQRFPNLTGVVGPLPARPRAPAQAGSEIISRHRLNGYLAQRVPSLSLASNFTMCSNCEVLEGMFPCRTRYPLS